MSKWDKYSSEGSPGESGSKWEKYVTKTEQKAPFIDIEGRLERRHQPTRYEQLMEKNKPGFIEWERGMMPKIPQGLPYAGEPIPFPRPTRLAGEIFDIPIDAALALGAPTQTEQFLTQKGVPQPIARGVGVNARLPELLMNPVPPTVELGKSILTGLGTTIAHPFASFRERPVETSADVALTIKGVQALGQGKEALNKWMLDRSINNQGKAAQQQVVKILGDEGKVLAEEKAIVRQMKGPYETTDVVAKTLKDIRTRGYSVYNGKDLRGIKEGLRQFGFKGNFASNANLDRLITSISKGKRYYANPESILEGRDLLNNKYINYKQVQGGATTSGQRTMLDMHGDANEILTFHDAQPELGGTGGQWIAHNDKYSQLKTTANQVRGVANETNGYRNMNTWVRKMVSGDQDALEIWKNVDNITGGDIAERALDAGIRSRGMSQLSGSIPGQVALAPTLGVGNIARSYLRPLAREATRVGGALPLAGVGLAAIPTLSDLLRERQQKEKDKVLKSSRLE